MLYFKFKSFFYSRRNFHDSGINILTNIVLIHFLRHMRILYSELREKEDTKREMLTTHYDQ